MRHIPLPPDDAELRNEEEDSDEDDAPIGGEGMLFHQHFANLHFQYKSSYKN